MNTRIIRTEFVANQGRYRVDYISTDSASNLPTTINEADIAYGSTAILPDGIYFFFTDNTWKKLGSEA
jgi:hypothetical protein